MLPYLQLDCIFPSVVQHSIDHLPLKQILFATQSVDVYSNRSNSYLHISLVVLRMVAVNSIPKKKVVRWILSWE